LIDAYKQEQQLLDLRCGLICAITANCYRDTNKHPEAFTPYDFGLPFLQEPESIEPPKSQAQRDYEAFQQVQAMTLRMGGKVVRK
jgi:hypothetical protein